MAYIFSKIAKDGNAAGFAPNKTAEARNWYRDAAKTVATANRNRLMADKAHVIGEITPNAIGRMYMFFYDPKLKEILPHYDIFPLVFPIEFYNDGFLGINLHYLPPVARAGLMDQLYNTTNNNKYDDSTKLNINYRFLKSASRFSSFGPCLKRYLYSQIKSGYLYIEPSNWDIAIMLPTERFKKQSKSTVQESVSKGLR